MQFSDKKWPRINHAKLQVQVWRDRPDHAGSGYTGLC